MSKTARRILFYSLILVFLIAGSGAALYAMGWRLDFSSWTAEKVGAIYVRSHPVDALIYIDGKPYRNRTGFFQPGTLINNLFPKDHSLTLSAPGYRSWERSVPVLTALVTEIKSAVLIPLKPVMVSAGEAKNFWLFNEEPILQDPAGKLVLQDQTLAGNEVLGWTNDSKKILTLDTKTNNYFWNDLENTTSTNIGNLYRKLGGKISTDTKFFLDSDNSNQLLITASTSLAILDLQRNTISILATSTNNSSTKETFTTVSPARFWIVWSVYDQKNNTSQLVLLDKFFGGKRVIANKIPGKTMELKWAGSSIFGFNQSDGEFYVFTPGEANPVHIASDVQNFAFTPSGEKIALLAKKSLEIISFKEKEDYRRFDRLPEARKVTGLTWYKDGQNLLISYPGTTAMLEMDDLHLENFATLASTDKIHYDSKNNQLYYLEKGDLMRLEFPE